MEVQVNFFLIKKINHEKNSKFNVFLKKGGLYYARAKKSEAVTLESMQLICLLPKSPNMREDLMEVLSFVAEDLNVLSDGILFFFFFVSIFFFPDSTTILGILFMDLKTNTTCKMYSNLFFVNCDLQGMADVFDTKHPTGNHVQLFIFF